MKLASLAFAALVGSAFAEPLLDVAHTQVQVDRTRSTLDEGAIQLSILRTDDLVSDDETHILLAERLSHIAVRIQLDHESAGVRVNDELIPLGNVRDEAANEVAVSIVKSDALVLPNNIPSSILADEQELGAAIASMSPGIVSLEVRIESELIEGGAVMGNDEQGEMRAMVVDGLRLRKVGVFIKINEVEGVDFAHSSLIYAPILQLLITSDTANGGKVTQIKTLSVGGQQPIASAPVLPGIAMVHDMLPELETKPEEVDAASNFDAHRHRRPHHGHRFLNWLASVFGMERHYHSGPSGSRGPRQAHGRPCPGKFRQGLAAAGGRHSNEEGMMRALPFDQDSPSPHHGFHQGQHHGHHRRRGGPLCFVRRFLRGFVHGFVFVFAVIFNSVVGQIGLGLLAGGMLFSVLRRTRRCRREVEELTSDVEVEKKVMDETVYVDELPRYEPVAIIVEEVPSRDEK